MKLHVGAVSGKTVTVEAEPSWSLQDLLAKVGATYGVAPSRKIFFGSRQLMPTQTLAEADVEDGAELLLVDSAPNMLVAAYTSGKVALWNADEPGEGPKVLRGHRQGVNYAEFSKDGTRVVTASDDCTTRVWDVNTLSTIWVLDSPEQPISPKKKKQLEKKGLTVEPLKYEFTHAAFSPDGAKVVATAGGTAIVCDAASGTQIFTLLTSFPQVVSFSPGDSSQTLVTAGQGIKVWDASTGDQLRQLTEKRCFNIRFCGDDKLLAFCVNEQPEIWSLGTGERLQVFALDEEKWAKAVSGVLPETPLSVAVVDSGGSIQVWDGTSGKLLRRLQREPMGPMGTDVIHEPAFSPDGRQLIVPCQRGPANLWDLQTGEVIRCVLIVLSRTPTPSPFHHMTFGLARPPVAVTEGLEPETLARLLHRLSVDEADYIAGHTSRLVNGIIYYNDEFTSRPRIENYMEDILEVCKLFQRSDTRPAPHPLILGIQKTVHIQLLIRLWLLSAGEELEAASIEHDDT
ncbi:pkwA [Symbiodinium sp. CCMP2456]|nr:pkwA [Symbiodinium sp. CCMP2456]